MLLQKAKENEMEKFVAMMTVSSASYHSIKYKTVSEQGIMVLQTRKGFTLRSNTNDQGDDSGNLFPK